MFCGIVSLDLALPQSGRYANVVVGEGLGGSNECVGGADPFQKELSVIALML
jgi:hypothetical protein